MQQGYFVPVESPTPPAPRKRKVGAVEMVAALAVLVVIGVSTYVMLNRLSEQVLTIIATIGCAAGVAVPGVLVALLVMVKRAEGSGRREVVPQQQPQMTQPMIMMVPPMAMPQMQGPQPAVWDSRPVERRFTVVGGGDGEWGE